MASLPGPPVHGRSFGRFDEIADLVENAFDLTPQILARQPPSRLPAFLFSLAIVRTGIPTSGTMTQHLAPDSIIRLAGADGPTKTAKDFQAVPPFNTETI